MQRLCPAPGELDGERELIPLYPADGEGPPQEEAGRRDLDEPPRHRRALRVAPELHHPQARSGEIRLRKLESHLFQARHTSLPLQMFKTQRPRTCLPPKGVALPFEAKAAGSIV